MLTIAVALQVGGERYDLVVARQTKRAAGLLREFRPVKRIP